jgi:hypothetical protein
MSASAAAFLCHREEEEGLHGVHNFVTAFHFLCNCQSHGIRRLQTRLLAAPVSLQGLYSTMFDVFSTILLLVMCNRLR